MEFDLGLILFQKEKDQILCEGFLMTFSLNLPLLSEFQGKVCSCTSLQDSQLVSQMEFSILGRPGVRALLIFHQLEDKNVLRI